MTPELKSAIIGYWRNGMPIEAICYYSGVEYLAVKNIIDNYLQ